MHSESLRQWGIFLHRRYHGFLICMSLGAVLNCCQLYDNDNRNNAGLPVEGKEG